MKDFFVSYNRHDRAWAEWIAWTLEAAGYTTVIQAWDFRAGGNFVLDMQKAASEAERTIAVLSENYLKSRFTAPEWAAAFAQDPTGEKHLLIPVRIGACEPTGLLGPIVYVDLVGIDEAAAENVLRRSLDENRAKPEQKPRFPGGESSQSDRPKPVFPPSIPSNLPPVSAIFVGREEELERLHTQLQTGDTVAISAISGMGGIGKTELAAQYALEQRDMGTYPGGICWLKAREDLGTQIVLFARSHLELAIPEDLELAAQMAYCWNHWRPGNTLLVLDDVQTYQAVAGVSVPQRSQFRVLLTTRLKLQSPVQDFEIKVLSEEKAIELLQTLVDRDRPDLRLLQEVGDLDTTKQICQWLGYLPLGIELVGRYLARKPDTSLETLWQRLQDKRLEAKALKAATREMPTPLGVAAAFELSWQELTPPAQRSAALLSLFALAEIPWTLVEACLPDMDSEDLEDLRDESLLTLHLLERTDQGMYQLHQLLREFFAAKREQMADVEQLKRSFCRVMVTVAQKIPRTATLDLIEQLTPVIPHLKEAATTLHSCLTNEDLIIPSTCIGRFYMGQANFVEALSWRQQCVEIAKERFGFNHPDVAASLTNLAEVHQAQGLYQDSERLYNGAFYILERLLPHYPDRRGIFLCVAATSNGLANLYCKQGRYDKETELLYQNALTVFRQELGTHHPLVATGLLNLGNLYRLRGCDGEAETCFLKSLKIREQELGTEHPDYAASLNSLAVLYHSQKRYEEADSLFTRISNLNRCSLGENHLRTATDATNLAGVYQSQERYEEAESLLIESLSIIAQQLGEEHPDIVVPLNNLAMLYGSQGLYSKAESFFLQALAIAFDKLEEDHPCSQTAFQNFLRFLLEVIQEQRTDELSDDPLTQELLRQMQQGEE
ncbi:tetratricopeptide repeat protein [Kovacikia minuta CCNUW1]|uniref:tetratricopeptide repeat protein n=1 Tax=Kovacikia minuta TaxID=2931930 RepID=UPI001CC9733A|nr:toll/interleukin-1 receptor domain-containing protein [Kovacikia minuta]UBF29071.1 tetratricopeptide repeat protein [Kovacikia minuta CCNUW1]